MPGISSTARALDRDAADQPASHGAFQVMGMHWKRLRYASVKAFVGCMSANGEDGQITVMGTIKLALFSTARMLPGSLWKHFQESQQNRC